MGKLCILCCNPTNGRKTFCSYCYFSNKAFIDDLFDKLQKKNAKRPSWLKLLEADAAKENRRRERESNMVSNWDE